MFGPGLKSQWLTALALCFGIYATLAALTMAHAGDCCRLEVEKVVIEPFEDKDGLYGFRLEGGMVLIEPRYLHASAFTPAGIAAVVDEKGWGYIDRTGEVLVRPHLVDNTPDPFSDGLARYVTDGRYGYFDEKARVVIEAAYAYAEPFEAGYALVCADCKPVNNGEHARMVGERWGVIDRSGAEVVAPGLQRNAAAEIARKRRTAG